MPLFRRHGAVIVGLLSAITLAGAGTAWYLLAVRLPNPRTASRAGLCRWLVLRDISAEPRDVQLALVDRLQAELKSGLAADASGVSLSSAYRNRLQENSEFLQRVWFEYRVEQYGQCRTEDQMPFLEQQIETIANWSAMQFTPETAVSSETSSAEDTALQFFSKIETWMEKAQGDLHSKMIIAVQDGVVCWLATRDLAEQPRGVRLGLAVRIARELDAGMRLDEILLDLTPPQREKLFANGELLLEAWLHDQARLYAKLPEAQRTQYVDARIDDVYKWGVLEVLAPAGGAAVGEAPSAAAAQGAGLLRFVALVDQWIERSSSEERPDLVRLVAHVQRQLLWRQFQRK